MERDGAPKLSAAVMQSHLARPRVPRPTILESAAERLFQCDDSLRGRMIRGRR
jgi:hypothetical protein